MVGPAGHSLYDQGSLVTPAHVDENPGLSRALGVARIRVLGRAVAEKLGYDVVLQASSEAEPDAILARHAPARKLA